VAGEARRPTCLQPGLAGEEPCPLRFIAQRHGRRWHRRRLGAVHRAVRGRPILRRQVCQQVIHLAWRQAQVRHRDIVILLQELGRQGIAGRQHLVGLGDELLEPGRVALGRDTLQIGADELAAADGVAGRALGFEGLLAGDRILAERRSLHADGRPDHPCHEHKQDARGAQEPKNASAQRSVKRHCHLRVWAMQGQI